MHPKLWSDMFSLGLPVLEKIMRPVIVYFFLVVALRLGGKRELAQLNPFDLVVLISLSNTVQNAMIGDDNSVLGGLLGASSLLAINFVVVRFLYQHPKIDALAEGDPVALIEGGKINTEAIEKEGITRGELESAAHRQGFPSVAEVDRAVLEVGGGISMIAKQPTPEMSRHREITERLERIEKTLQKLQSAE